MRRLLVLGLFAATACGAPEGALTLGTGLDRFDPLSEGASLEIVAGIQGGYHATLSLQAQGIEPGEVGRFHDTNPVIDFDVYDDGVRIDVSEALAFGLEPDESDDTKFVALGRRVVFANEAVEPLAGMEGRPLTVEVFLEDMNGTALSARVDVVAAPYALD